MEFKRFYAVKKGDSQQQIMPSNDESLEILLENDDSTGFTPTMGISESEEIKDAAKYLGEGAEIDMYEVTFRKIRSGRIEQDKSYVMVDDNG